MIYDEVSGTSIYHYISTKSRTSEKGTRCFLKVHQRRLLGIGGVGQDPNEHVKSKRKNWSGSVLLIG